MQMAVGVDKIMSLAIGKDNWFTTGKYITYLSDSRYGVFLKMTFLIGGSSDSLVGGRIL